MKWDTIKYIDCLDKDEGLPSLPDNSIEICFTDPPYNVGYKNKKASMKRFTTFYTDIDKKTDAQYLQWCKSWFEELKRVCSGSILIHCGNPNLNMWIADIEKPIGILMHYKEDVQSTDRVAHLSKLTPILVYGNLKKRFKINPIKVKNKYDKSRGRFSHPCPMNSYLVVKVLERQEPVSCIDIFAGSGTIPRICKLLNIKFIGYEVNKGYRDDIQRRFSQSAIMENII